MKRKRIFEILEPNTKNDKLGLIFDKFLIILIILNVALIILESFESLSTNYSSLFKYVEIISIVIFTIEYLLRIITSDYLYPSNSISKSLFKYITSPMAIIDLLAIIPFYLPFLISIDLRILRILRLTRLFRLFKINRYTRSLKIISKVLRKKKEQLIVTIFVTVIMLLLSSSIMYIIETDEQPENFPNIIASLWWSVATLTTVGYGDVYPITILGKILSGIIALLGIGLVALPTGIISSGFIEEIDHKNDDIKRKKRIKKVHKGIRKLNNKKRIQMKHITNNWN